MIKMDEEKHGYINPGSKLLSELNMNVPLRIKL
jgi:hypothetical protein